MSDCSCRHPPECHRPGWNIGCGGWTDSGDPCPCKWDGRSKSDRDLLKRAAEALRQIGECPKCGDSLGRCSGFFKNCPGATLSAIEARLKETA